MNPSLRIAITGIRGVPALYGGPETCAREVSMRLAERGYHVTAYCRPGFHDDSVKLYRGVHRVVLPTIRTTATETYFHTLISILHAVSTRHDVVLIFNAGAGGLSLIARMFRTPVVLNPDGFDWRRTKWGPFARWFIKTNAWFSTKVCNQLITDSISVRDYYNDDWKCSPAAIYVPYGAPIEPENPSSNSDRVLANYGVTRGRYFFFLSRHVPENTCEEILQAFEPLAADGAQLLFGGGGDSDYARSLRRYAGEAILMPGVIESEDEVAVLHRNCFAVVHGNQPGGTSLGLLKAMGYGCCVATPNTPDNAFVVADAGYTYPISVEGIRETLRRMWSEPEEVLARAQRARIRIQDHYDWNHVTDQYAEIIERVAGQSRASSNP